MKKDKQKTDVIFRKFKEGDIIAIFPAIPGTNNWRADCESYMHIGQHGSCSIDIVDVTTPAHPKEYSDLLNELRGIGYNLNIINRFNAKHRQARKEEIERIKGE